MKRCVLHVGFPKTGTTSIQKFCRVHRDALAGKGIFYPSLHIPDASAEERASHKALMVALLKEPPTRLAPDQPRSKALVDGAIAEFRAGAAETIFLSHETISQRKDIDYDQLGAWLGGFEVEVLAFVRTFDEWLESLYAQNLRAEKNVSRPFRQSRLGRLQPVRYLPQLRALKAGLPGTKLTVLSFDRYRKGGLVERVLQTLGTDMEMVAEAGTKVRRANVGRETLEVMFGAYASIALDDPTMTQKVLRAFEAANRAGAQNPVTGEFRLVPPDLKSKARQMYLDDLPKLRAQFGLDADDPSPLTPDDLNYSHNLTKDQFDALLDFLTPYLGPADVDRIGSVYEKAHPLFA